jgi:type 1 fimbria pilin
MKKLNILLIITAAVALLAFPSFAHEGETHEGQAKETGGNEVTVSGEVIDMVCYIDHGATGSKHTDCAQTCINLGLPVGIKADDGKTYLLVGEHKPINSDLASLAAKTITVKGKLVSRDGFNMIENVEIVKK